MYANCIVPCTLSFSRPVIASQEKVSMLSCWPNSCFLMFSVGIGRIRVFNLATVINCGCFANLQLPGAPSTCHEQRDKKKNTARCGCSFFDQSCCKKWQKGSFLCVDVKQVVFFVSTDWHRSFLVSFHGGEFLLLRS